MFRIVILSVLLCSFANAQTKKNALKQKPVEQTDSLSSDTSVVEVIDSVSHEFGVKTKLPKDKKGRVKLCLNLISADTVLNFCVNDSVLKNPEVSKVLFQKQSGDTNYVLVYVAAFSKPLDKVACEAGKEVKLFFVRWNTKTNKFISQQKIIESCMRGIDNMTKFNIPDWDGKSTLVVNYYRGANNFMELKFDPDHYLSGLQSEKEF